MTEETIEQFAERLCPNMQVEYDMIIEGARFQKQISDKEIKLLKEELEYEKRKNR